MQAMETALQLSIKAKGKQIDAMKPKGGTARGRAEVNSDTIVEDRSQAPKRPGGDIDDSERAGRDEKPKNGKGDQK